MKQYNFHGFLDVKNLTCKHYVQMMTMFRDDHGPFRTADAYNLYGEFTKKVYAADYI